MFFGRGGQGQGVCVGGVGEEFGPCGCYGGTAACRDDVSGRQERCVFEVSSCEFCQCVVTWVERDDKNFLDAGMMKMVHTRPADCAGVGHGDDLRIFPAPPRPYGTKVSDECSIMVMLLKDGGCV